MSDAGVWAGFLMVVGGIYTIIGAILSVMGNTVTGFAWGIHVLDSLGPDGVTWVIVGVLAVCVVLLGIVIWADSTRY